MLDFRLLPFGIADGAGNMAADEALLLSASGNEGLASLRFYGWKEATLSLGYFQPATARLSDPRLASLPWVRRPTGGAALAHHFELTYALAVPLTAEGRKPRSWMAEMHRIVARALDDFGLRGKLESAVIGMPTSSRLCFEQPAAGDLLCGPHKLLGSSQRKHHHALLQHGALLLAQSPFTPTLPAIRELTGIELAASDVADAIADAFRKVTQTALMAATWSSEEERMIDRLVREKYSRAEWNEKR